METLADLAEILIPLTALSLKPMIHRGVEMRSISDRSNSFCDGSLTLNSSNGHGQLLESSEMVPQDFVEQDPWFAGYFAVVINLSNIAAAGGRATAIFHLTWTFAEELPAGTWDGIQAASCAYGVPIGSEILSGSEGLTVTINGLAGDHMIHRNNAQPGDLLAIVIDMKGSYREGQNVWDASTSTSPQRLRSNLELIPSLAEKGLCCAGMKIGKGGLIATLAALCEYSALGATVDLGHLPCPSDSAITKWLLTEPTYGYLFAITPEDLESTLMHFTSSKVTCQHIGHFRKAPGITLVADGENVDLTFGQPGIHPSCDVFHAGESIFQ